MSILPNKKCNVPLMKPANIEQFFSEHWCVQESESERPVIDAGAPITCRVGWDSNVRLVGIASFPQTSRVLDDEGPKVFTSVPGHHEWIKNKLKNL